MIQNTVPAEEKDYFSIGKVRIIKFVQDFSTEAKELYEAQDNKISFNQLTVSPFYGYNNLFNYKKACEQVILFTDVITSLMEKAGISSEPIKLDTFYGESILNA